MKYIYSCEGQTYSIYRLLIEKLKILTLAQDFHRMLIIGSCLHKYLSINSFHNPHSPQIKFTVSSVLISQFSKGTSSLAQRWGIIRDNRYKNMPPKFGRCPVPTYKYPANSRVCVQTQPNPCNKTAYGCHQ